MDLLVLNIQSVSDVITNSSSELFVLDTTMHLEDINGILCSFTSGFQYPFRFNLEEFRKSRAEYEKWEEEWEREADEKRETLSDKEYADWVDSTYNVRRQDSLWGWDGIYSAVCGWFTDVEDEDSLTNHRIDCLRWDVHSRIGEEYDKWIHSHEKEYKDENGEIWPYACTFSEHYESNKEFLLQYEKNYLDLLPGWWIPKSDSIQNLDGKVLVCSEEDNSIPYDDFEMINEVFNGYNIHLG